VRTRSPVLSDSTELLQRVFQSERRVREEGRGREVAPTDEELSLFPLTRWGCFEVSRLLARRLSTLHASLTALSALSSSPHLPKTTFAALHATITRREGASDGARGRLLTLTDRTASIGCRRRLSFPTSARLPTLSFLPFTLNPHRSTIHPVQRCVFALSTRQVPPVALRTPTTLAIISQFPLPSPLQPPDTLITSIHTYRHSTPCLPSLPPSRPPHFPLRRFHHHPRRQA
jgi:hypothetical protein